MERRGRFAGYAFRRLWRAWGGATNPSTRTSFVKFHPIEIQMNFLALAAVDTALRRRPVRSHSGGHDRLVTVAPPVEAGGGVGSLGQGQEGVDGVRRGD